MSQQVVAEQHRLGVLQVRASRHRRVRVGLGLPDQGVDDAEHLPGDDPGVVAQVHPPQGGDLVVARAPRAQLAAQGGPGPLDQALLERPVHVLIARGRRVGPGAHVGLEFVQGREHPVQLGVGEQLAGVQHPGVGTGAGDVVRGQAPVELGGLGQGRERVRRAAGEAPAPQGAVVGAVLGVLGHHSPSRWSRAEATLEDIPNSSMKPLAWDWSKESPSS